MTEAITSQAILVAGEVRDLYEAADFIPYLPVITALEAAVAEERRRCAMVVRRHLSPRNGLFLAKRPGEALLSILDEIERGDEP